MGGVFKRNLIILRVLALAGLAVSIISLVHYFNLHLGLQKEASFCNINSSFNCDAVNQSKWSSFLNIPLAAYGGAFYIFVFLISFLRNINLKSKILLAVSFLSVLLSIYLFYVSEFVIGTLCLLCVGMYAANFILCWLAYSINKVSGQQTAKLSFSGSFFGLSFSALLSLMYLFNISNIVYVLMLFSDDFYRSWQNQPVVEFKLDKDYFKGPPDAPVTIVEFSDLECSACRRFYLGLEEMLPEYKGKVRIVFKNYPLDRACNSLLKGDMHMTACYAAIFARCAGEQDKFWETVDYIYRLDYTDYAANRMLIKDKLQTAYGILGLDEQAMKECVESGRPLAKIKSDINEGQALDVQGTPAIWINGKKTLSFTEQALKNIFNGILHRD